MKSTKSRKGAPSLAPRRSDWRQRCLQLGVLAGGLGVSVTMLPAALSPFGPAKALVLALSGVLVSVALCADPERVVGAVRRLGRVKASLAAPLFVLVGVLATVTSLDPRQSLVGHYAEYQGLLLVVMSLLLGLGAAVLAADENGWTFLRRWGAAAIVVVGVVAAWQLAAAGGDLNRVTSTLGNASNLGVWLCLATPLALACARAERSRSWSALGWAAVALGVVMIVLTLSRGAWVGAVCAALAWVLVESRGASTAKRVRWAAIAAGAVLVVGLVALLAVPHAASRVFEAIRNPMKGSLGWRLEVWRITAGMVAARPFLGFGPASFRYAFPPVRTAVTILGQTRTQIVDDPHNLSLSLAVQYGLAGLGLFVWLVVGNVRALWKSAEDESTRLSSAALIAGIIGGVAALQAHFFTLDTWPLFGMLAGFGFGLAAIDLSPAGLEPLDERPERTVAWAARAGFATSTAAFVFITTCALGLVLSDAPTARGIRLAQAKAPWRTTRLPLEQAAALAWWEPTARLTIARAATQSLNTRYDALAFRDGANVFAALARTLPADPLVPAQAAELYILAGIQGHDAPATRRGLELAQTAVKLDPNNGFRWETLGSAYFALEDLGSARDAYERAVALNPRDAQGWTNLSNVYNRLGLVDKANRAMKSAKRAANLPVVRFQ